VADATVSRYISGCFDPSEDEVICSIADRLTYVELNRPAESVAGIDFTDAASGDAVES
jgi:hypothetical protein